MRARVKFETFCFSRLSILGLQLNYYFNSIPNRITSVWFNYKSHSLYSAVIMSWLLRERKRQTIVISDKWIVDRCVTD